MKPETLKHSKHIKLDTSSKSLEEKITCIYDRYEIENKKNQK